MTCALFSKLFVIQTQSRSRDCNEAKYGGNTAICTSAEGETQPCNNDICRKFVLSFGIIRISGLQNRIFAQLWMQAGPSGGLGPRAAKPVTEG